MKVYLPIERKDSRGVPPWGYAVPTDMDAKILQPIKSQLDVLEKGFDYLDEGASFQKVADFITQKSGVSISISGLRQRYYNDPDREEGRLKRKKLVSNFTDNHPTKKYKKRTPEEKAVIQRGQAKARLTKAEKRLAKLKESKARAEAEIQQTVEQAKDNVADNNVNVSAEAPEAVHLSVEPTVKAANVITPNPGPQTDFLAASEREVLYGGAAGGGKSFALVIDPLRTVHLKSHKAITFRRTTDELRSLIAMTKEIYTKVIPGAKFLEQKSTWVFPAGGTHWYRFLDRDDDVTSLQGQDFTWIGFDELTQWSTPFVFNYMRSRLRTDDPEIRPYLSMRATSNPGGAGHDWVKRTFVNPAPHNTPFPAQDLETGETLRYPPSHPKAGQVLFYRRFIPAKLKDNPYLFEAGDYEANLLALPEVQRRQLLEGDWDIAEGAAFTEFRRYVHTCEPFDIPAEWRKFRACDWGYDKPHCVLWFALSPDGTIYVYREIYGRKVLSSDLADKVLSAEMGENVMYGILDRHAWDVRDASVTPAQAMIARGCQWRPANQGPGSRVSGKQEIHRRLQLRTHYNETTGEEIQKPSVIIFNTCVNLIRTLPSIPLDKSNTEDVDSDSEDHAYDAFRYGLASKPMARNERYVINAVSFAPPVRYDNFGFPLR